MRSLRAFAISFVLSSILFGIIAYNVVNQAFNITFEVPTLSDSTAQIDVDDQISDPARPTKPTKPVVTTPASKDEAAKDEPTKDSSSKDNDKNKDKNQDKNKDKNQNKETEDKTPATNAPDLDKIKLPQGKESDVTFLFVSTDYMPSAFNYKSSGYDENGLYVKKRKISVDNLLLVKIDRSSQSFMFSSIPGNTLMNSNKTISDFYNDKGAAYMVDCVYALTGLQVEFFSVIGVDEMTNVFKKLGKVTFDVPCNMQQKDEANKIDVDLKAGVQNLSADMVVDLLRFSNYDEDFIYTRDSVHVDFAQAMFEKFTSASYYKNAKKLYKDVFSCFESNFAEKDFNNHIDLIFSYKKYQSLVVTYPGYESEENGKLVFVPSTGEALSAYSDFK